MNSIRKIFTLFFFVFIGISAYEQEPIKTCRPKVEVKSETIYKMVDTAISVINQHLDTLPSHYIFKIYELEAEGTHRCWLEGKLTSDELLKLKDGWNDDKDWLQGFFCYKNALVFVQTDILGINFMFTNHFEIIDIGNLLNNIHDHPTIIIGPTVNDEGRIEEPFYVFD